ncbi:MAG: class I SAM-dependent methyltransferase [Mucilaginibacter polytrichastri]|nr:class I SAM-dependent methyltransferase [Mucilaginibacter polytrichastri]
MNYDPIARNYDWLSRLVFGRSQVRAQTSLLPFIPAGSRILIVGGGTGWILDELSALHPGGLSIDYVEASAKMTELARTKNRGENSITFHTLPVLDFQSDAKYDAVLTFFLFDNFPQEEANRVFGHIESLLAPGALWLYADFTPENSASPFWQTFLFRLMYLFFRLICRIPARRMPDMGDVFSTAFHLKQHRTLYGGFIESKLFVGAQRNNTAARSPAHPPANPRSDTEY